MPMSARDYTWLFTPKSSFAYEDSGPTGVIHVVDGGELSLPTGRVIACDPFVYLGTGDIEPFTATVEPGRYRVETAVATLTHPGEEPSGTPHRRVAAARLVIRDEPAATWELALLPDQDPPPAGRGGGARGRGGPPPGLAGVARAVLAQLAALHSPELLE
ncbi:DUF4241 domain-containing protein, partial [Streptomyces sp. NPDC059597]|uniref:DUF4241 domain-containing protein n=1 Tax=Streptomyces sp. NPDC059597 TaxID=3346879 RepID=UPI0036D1BABC